MSFVGQHRGRRIASPKRPEIIEQLRDLPEDKELRIAAVRAGQRDILNSLPQEVPVLFGVFAFSANRDRALALVNGSGYFVWVFNGSDCLAVTERDKDATGRSLGIYCRERGWSKPRALYELQNGLPFRTVPPLPPGVSIDWHNPNVTHGLNVETGDLKLILGVSGGPGLSFDTLTVSIEVMPPPDADPLSSVRWAIDTTRNLRAENKIPKGVRKADLARLLEAEAQKAVRGGKLQHALMASYLENQLENWGIWPLDDFK